MRSTVRLSMDYPCRPQRLWKALTDPRSLADWLGPITGRADGGLRFGAAACSVVAREPNSRLVWRWRDPREGRTFVISWRIEPVATGCRLRFEQHEATAADAASFIAQGDPAALDDASGDSSFIAGNDLARGDEAATGDDDSAGDLPGIAPDEVQVYGELTLAA